MIIHYININNMERRLNKKINDYVHTFKTDITEKIKMMANEDNDTEFDIVGLTNYVYEYSRFEFQKDDFMKRKRVKNTVPNYERCCAKRASGEQCTRRRKDELQYCGTHSKGTPHGICDPEENTKPQGQKIEVWLQDIQGIVYYID